METGQRLLALLQLLAVLCDAVNVSSTAIGQQYAPSTCTHSPNGLKVESRYTDVGDRRWANQCPAKQIISAMWFEKQEPIVSDVKCCHGDVDQKLSHPVLDFHTYDKGVSEPSQRWQIECKPNHVVTALHVSQNLDIGYSKHVSAMKCSLLVGAVVKGHNCVRIDNTAASGGSRLSNVTWSAQCPSNMAVVGLFDDDKFRTVRFTKCCPIEAHSLSLPFHCDFSGGNFCGWTQDIDDDTDWKYLGANGGNYHYLSLGVDKGRGVARLSSPGYSKKTLGLCLRMYYFLSGYRPKIDVLLRYSDPHRQLQNITTLESIQSPLGRPNTIDVAIGSHSNFQLIIEGRKSGDHVSLINIMDLKLLPADDCQIDLCSPPSTGCGPNAYCLPVNGLLRCQCMKDFRRVDGQCQSSVTTDFPASQTPYQTTPDPPLTIATGNRGGDGKDGKDGEITPPPVVVTPDGGTDGKTPIINKGTGSKFQKNPRGISRVMYSVFGGAGGMVIFGLIIVLLFGYRRMRATRQQNATFNVELLQRGPPSLSSGPDEQNNIVGMRHLKLPNECKIASWQCKPFRSLSVGSGASMIESSLVCPSSPQSRHYYEIEPSIEKKEHHCPHGVLDKPVYGSNNELDSHAIADNDIFFEPPSDERELRAQLKRQLNRSSIQITTRTLGEGAFGYVQLGSLKEGCSPVVKVAVKMLKEPATSKDRVMFFREAVIMCQFTHTNVIHMYGVMAKEYPPMIVLEYMSRGNLKKYLSRLEHSRNNDSVIDYQLHCTLLRFARDIVAGMTYLSQLKFVHRDLAARNILLNSSLTCKIGDFGLARDLIGADHYTSKERTFPYKWTAPEALLYNRFSSSSDVWSYGIVLFEIWALGSKPYKEFDNKTVTDYVCNKSFRLPPPKHCPRVIYNIMMDCWHPDDRERPRFSQLKYCLGQSDMSLVGNETDTDLSDLHTMYLRKSVIDV